MTTEQNTQNQPSATEEPKTKEPKGPYRFLNPYNFVRYLERERPDGHLLGNCPPPPHDRYVGLTGRITCRVEAKTPLFISDTHAMQELKDKEGHKVYRFFEYEGQPALPASSLRGMIRAAFEAVTNSCFTVFDGGRFDLRKGKLPANLVPARVVEIDGKGAKLEVLDCSQGDLSRVWLHWDRRDRVIALMNAASIPAYLNKVLNTRLNPNIPFDPRKSRIPAGIKDGDRVAALVGERAENHGVYQYLVVKELVPIKDQKRLLPRPGTIKVFGYVHLTGPNIENKHFERLFFRWDDTQAGKVIWSDVPESSQVKVKSETIKEYNDHLNAYWDRNRRQVEKLDKQGSQWSIAAKDLPHPSYFIKEGRKLREGDLVYYLPTSKMGIPLLRPVLMSRLPYQYSRQDLMLESSPHLRRCPEPAMLCPACRVFGWVSGEDKPAPAYAGRVRLSQGKAVAGTIQTFEDPIPLAILSSPKPTTTNFYLVKGDGQPDETGGLNYDDKHARLRGRKVYRHHGRMLSEQEYVRTGERKEDDQNRTIKGVLKSGSAFTFTVEFENLAKEELGALLWTLELGGWHHRLGFAKPLGFGSVLVNVEKVEVCDLTERYTELGKNGWRTVEESIWRERCVNLFKAKMKELYNEDFFELKNIKDLQALLTESLTGLPIHYPRPSYRDTVKPNPEGMQFEWFVGNKRRVANGNNPKPLPLASLREEGLPLLEKDGKEYNGSS